MNGHKSLELFKYSQMGDEVGNFPGEQKKSILDGGVRGKEKRGGKKKKLSYYFQANKREVQVSGGFLLTRMQNDFLGCGGRRGVGVFGEGGVTPGYR